MSEPRHEPAPEPVPEPVHEANRDTPPGIAETPEETLHVDLFEGAWMRIAAVVLAVFFISIIVSAFASGFQVPGVYQRVDPAKLYEPGSPFAEPGLRELAPG